MKKQTLFYVVSEVLVDYPTDRYEPPEQYRTVDLVVAPTRGKAQILAAKYNRDYEGDMRDLPRYSVRKIASGFCTVPRVVSQEKSWQEFWKATP